MTQSIYSLPIYFNVKNEISTSDDRFLEVEIDVLHTGLNFNGSVFNKEVVDKGIETIKNTPILGFIRVLPDGEKDFKGHEYIITKTDKDGITRRYIGSAFGVIPESCNPRWVKKISEDCEEREYLRVDGLLWTKFSEAIDIMVRDRDKPHSMELFPNNIDGYEDESGNFIFTNFSFDGCCILGSTDDIQPAMISSNIKIKDKEVQFTMTDFVKNLQSELNDKFTTFTKLVNEKTNQGGIRVMPNTDFGQTVLQQFEDISAIVREHELVQDRWGDAVPRYCVYDIQDNEVIVVDKKDNYRYYGFPFTINGDKVEIDFSNGKRKKLRFDDYEEGTTVPDSSFDFGKHISELEDVAFAKIEEADEKTTNAKKVQSEAETNYSQIKADYDEIKSQYDEIKPKYDEYVKDEAKRQSEELNAQKDAKFAEYEDVLSDNADFVALKEKRDEMSVDEIEKECAVLYVRANRSKANFSKSCSTSATVEVMSEDDDVKGFVRTKYGLIRVKEDEQ